MATQDEGIRNGSATTIEEELRKWPESVYHDVAEAESVARTARQAQQRSHKKNRILIACFGLVLLICISLALFLYFKNRSEAQAPERVANVAQTPDVQNGQLNVGSTENAENYKKTEATVVSNGQEILKVIKYDFYPSKFIVNNTALKNQESMVATFRGLQGQLKDSWILIFASASLERYEDYNLELCRKRLFAVRDLLAHNANIEPRGYWGILAGEFKIDMANIPRERWEEEEERIARERGEEWLSDQRRLIIITIRQVGPLSAEARDKVPFLVDKYLYEKDMLPRDYDAPDSTPFVLNERKTVSKSDPRSPNP